MMRCLPAALGAALVLVFQPNVAVAQSAFLTLPDVSQHARVVQRIGLTDITIDYHRPRARQRKILEAFSPMAKCGAPART